MSKRTPFLLLCLGTLFVLGLWLTPAIHAAESPTETPTETPIETPTETPTPIPTATPVPPTATPIPATATPIPVVPTETPVETPTETPIETPTETPVEQPTATPTPTQTPKPQVPGDADGDGIVTDEDITSLLQVFLTIDTPTAEQLAILDMNKDGKITPQDAQDLYKKLHP